MLLMKLEDESEVAETWINPIHVLYVIDNSGECTVRMADGKELLSTRSAKDTAIAINMFVENSNAV